LVIRIIRSDGDFESKPMSLKKPKQKKLKQQQNVKRKTKPSFSSKSFLNDSNLSANIQKP